MNARATGVVTALAGFVVLAGFFAPDLGVGVWTARAVAAELEKWAQILTALGFVLGVAHIIARQWEAIRTGHPDAPYKWLLLAAMGGMIGIGVVERYVLGRDIRASGTVFDWVVRHAFEPLQATMFALLAFHLASAALRAFRSRSVESALLWTAAILVMLGNVPLGLWLTGGASADVLAWILEFPNTAGQRVIILGASLGVLSTSLRILLGLERSYLTQRGRGEG